LKNIAALNRRRNCTSRRHHDPHVLLQEGERPTRSRLFQGLLMLGDRGEELQDHEGHGHPAHDGEQPAPRDTVEDPELRREDVNGGE
jgi:hypothetical protein